MRGIRSSLLPDHSSPPAFSFATQQEIDSDHAISLCKGGVTDGFHNIYKSSRLRRNDDRFARISVRTEDPTRYLKMKILSLTIKALTAGYAACFSNQQAPLSKTSQSLSYGHESLQGVHRFNPNPHRHVVEDPKKVDLEYAVHQAKVNVGQVED